MKKCIVGRASVFCFALKLPNCYLWDCDDTSKSWSFPQAKLPTISLSASIYLLTLAGSVILFPWLMETYHLSILPWSWEIHRCTWTLGARRVQATACGLVAANGEAQHVFCLPVINKGVTGESLERNEAIFHGHMLFTQTEYLQLSSHQFQYCVWIKQRCWDGNVLSADDLYDFVI